VNRSPAARASDPAGEGASAFAGAAGEAFLSAHRDKIFYSLAIVATLVLLPFSIANFADGHYFLGAVVVLLVAVFVIDAIAITRGRQPPIPPAFAFVPILVGIVAAIQTRGMMTVLWTYPAILLFHFVLERRQANLINVAMVLVSGPLVYANAGFALAVRVVATQILTIVFTNIFSAILLSEQRREVEQRRRLGLLVRATQSGFFEWDATTNSSTYSGRLKEMLGYPPDYDMSHWGSIAELIHPDDREARRRVFQDSVRQSGEPNSVRRGRGGDFRFVHRDGHPVWVHAQSVFIHGSDGRVQRFVSSLVDVSERHRQEEALRASRDQIEIQAKQLVAQNATLLEAIRVREEVERIARHDIKTPLNSIVSVPQMLRESGPLTRRQGDLLELLERSAYRILDMVNLSVDIYRMEQGQYRFQPRAVDLAELVESIAREIRSHAITKGVVIDVERGAGGPPVLAWAEELLCYSIIANLLKNAVEASPDGERVRVRLEAGDAVVLEIRNAGEVPEAVRRTFFEKYATSGKAGGFGLGTYSARLMARVQEGDLTMRSSAAEGTTLRLQLRAVPRDAVPARGPAPQHAIERGRTDALALPAMKVLIVDDDEFNVAFLQNSLPSPPLVVDTAINGRAAVDAFATRPADVVFMDLDMPVMNGFEALERIRGFERTGGRRPCVMVAFSSFDDEETRRRCAAAGFDHYLGKPASRAQLRALLLEAAGGAPHAAGQAAASVKPVAAVVRQEDPVIVDADVRSVLPGFMSSRKEIFAEMRQALEGNDRESLRRLAHKLVGGFALYGFRWAREESFAIERAAFAADSDVLRERIDALGRHLETVEIQGR